MLRCCSNTDTIRSTSVVLSFDTPAGLLLYSLLALQRVKTLSH